MHNHLIYVSFKSLHLSLISLYLCEVYSPSIVSIPWKGGQLASIMYRVTENSNLQHITKEKNTILQSSQN